MARNAEMLPDTNVLLRYLLRDDAHQFAVTETFFEQVRTGRERVILLEGVLVECLYVLTKQYRVSRSAAAAALTGLLQYKGVVNPDKAVLLNALNRYAASRFDPVDCLLLAMANQSGLRIFSFDQELNKAALGTPLLSKTPQ